MRKLADLVATIPLPAGVRPPSSSDDGARDGGPPGAVRLLTQLAAGLPAGHVHLWGGPNGAGKTSVLLTLLGGAAQCNRRVLYVTYDLPALTLAKRLLAMTAGVAPDRLPDPGGVVGGSELSRDEWSRVAAARHALSKRAFHVLEARGLTAGSLRDRLARMPFRADVMAVDYLQAVVRPRATTVQSTVTQLTELAQGMHVAVVCTVRPDHTTPNLKGILSKTSDRFGWIEPDGDENRRADIVGNRHGAPTSRVLRLCASGALEVTRRAEPRRAGERQAGQTPTSTK